MVGGKALAVAGAVIVSRNCLRLPTSMLRKAHKGSASIKETQRRILQPEECKTNKMVRLSKAQGNWDRDAYEGVLKL